MHLGDNLAVHVKYGYVDLQVKMQSLGGKPSKALIALFENGSSDSMIRPHVAVAQDFDDMKSCKSGAAIVVGE